VPAERALVVQNVTGEAGVAAVEGGDDGGDGLAFNILDFTEIGKEALQVTSEFDGCHLNSQDLCSSEGTKVLVLFEGGFVAFAEIGEELADFFVFVNEDSGPGADDFFAGLEEGGGVLAEEGFPFGVVELGKDDAVADEEGEEFAIGLIAGAAEHFFAADLGPAEDFLFEKALHFFGLFFVVVFHGVMCDA
jgi:hypothetical protein